MRLRFALIILILACASVEADDIVFPKDSGVLNAKDFGARGDGLKDDTAAIQQALDKYPNGGRIIYLPNGTYRVSDTLNWPHGTVGGQEEKNTILQGQSRDKVILRLIDAAPGFTDAKTPKAMIWTGQAPAQRFRNAVRDLTIDTGRKNPGAIGARFMANNQGTIRDVTIRSSDGKALIGLDLGYTDENGPLLVKDVKVVGFDYGVRASHAVDSLTIEGLTLQDQNRFGLVNEGQCLSIRGLTSRNVVTAVVNSGAGVLTLLDADLRGSRAANARPAVVSDAFLFAANVSSVGYAETIRNTANSRRPDPGRTVAEFVSHPPLGGAASRPKPLAVKETPTVPWDDLKDWASPTHFGAKPDDDLDDAPAIQKAIDSGKTTIYFPAGSYKIGRTVMIRGKARRLIGCEATLIPDDLKGEPAFRMVEGASPVVVFERFGGGYATTPTLDNTSSRTLVVKHCCNTSGRFTGSGDLFLEDVCSNPFTSWRFGKQNVWARQFNVENEGTHIVNDGGKLWVLGLKTERGGTLIETRGGGVTEVRGGLCYTTTDPNGAPMFMIEDGSLAATIGESCFTGKPYDVLVKTPKTELRKGQAPQRTGGSVLPLFVDSAKP